MVIKEKRASTRNETEQERDLSGCTITLKQIQKTRKNKIQKKRERESGEESKKFRIKR